MKVLSNRVFVELKKSGLELKSGLILPDKNDGIIEKGIVYAAGIECEFVKEGDEVHVHYADGRELRYEGKDLIVVREHDIQFKVEREENGDEEKTNEGSKV